MVTVYNRHVKPIGGGHHYEGIGSIYKSSRGLRGYGNLRHQFGSGFGSFLAKIFGKAVPFLKNRVLPALKPALGEVKKSLTDAAANIVEDVIQGENVMNSVKKNVASEGKKLLAKAPAAFTGILRKAPNATLDSTKLTEHQATPSKRQKRKKVSFISNGKRPRTAASRFPGLSRF
jgi:hypothetical protein